MGGCWGSSKPMEGLGEGVHLALHLLPLTSIQAPSLEPLRNDSRHGLPLWQVLELVRRRQHVAHQFSAGMDIARRQCCLSHPLDRGCGIALKFINVI